MISSIAPLTADMLKSESIVSARDSVNVSAPSGGISFGQLLSETAMKTVNNLEAAEATSIKALQGDADTRQVVDAIMSAEQSLQSAVAIRDKIVNAYLEISRMAI
ncbi:flagellar hook-basal body complex protein FliE [Limoniibacter endophyticus]|uniref:Flagellar hook-basal body complex protein FliE n=1 Tax=Limoniibacter endophyticus TaxID=1565040 RepID=A0A8J3DFK5_9HYPH|nr:flagellar hook-basal body complex protein FliE [Limoniibacter endophyticus]GHC64585.1 hypothetical protein GCM10010136_06640 [Limoniibacter endophyticus]